MNLERLTSSEEILDYGDYGWHGCGTTDAVFNITFNNLDIKKRNGQSYGVGEYCAKIADPAYSQRSFWKSTNTLFLF